ncbi:hypothetical protein AAU61_07125 [Desulfocarbo indianensis]|nr:hypothetical protein AAU61_07125 [Desulfocarbo indianensis]
MKRPDRRRRKSAERERLAGDWLAARFFALHSGIIPASMVKELDPEQIKAFLHQEDPASWPPGIGHLAIFADLHKKSL